MSEGILPLAKELLVVFLSDWPVFGAVLKMLKSLARHETIRPFLNRCNEASKLLLGVARLLCRLPEQRKLLKRVSRTLWLLAAPCVLPVLPSLEPQWQLPSRDAPHLAMPSGEGVSIYDAAWVCVGSEATCI